MRLHFFLLFFFFFNDTATTEIYTLSLHDALPILVAAADDSHRAPRQQRHVAPGVEQRRGPRDFGEQRGKRRVAGQQHRRAQPVERVQDLEPDARRAPADRRRGRAGEARQRGDGAVRGVERRLCALERGDERGEPRGPDPRQLRQGQIGGYFVATPARSDCHRVSKSGGTPSPVTAAMPTTGAPASVRMVGSAECGARSRSSLVSTTTWGLAPRSGEYAAASRRSSS